jgi:hypothetical protein
MTFKELMNQCDWIVDDTGNGRLRGSDQHAIVRIGGVDDFCNRSAFAVFEDGPRRHVVAVNSYLDVWLDDNEVVEIATGWWREQKPGNKSHIPHVMRG